ncbi:MAG: type II secretion system protein [Candidatus Peribacteraceae bacterium]|nr:type II secretion system protein [Candidatus Peribacteraceae bacterium]MDD5074868.1 type II secretion system protein [Candidatus Peribacteraceae bacterium]
MKLSRSRKGFTLIELLLVIGIIAILASIVIVAINPTKQLGDARNAQRRSDVNTVLNAVYQYAIDHNGTMPGCLADTATVYPAKICTTATCTGVTGGCDLTPLTSTYIVALPKDPSYVLATNGEDSLYTISLASGRVTVSAPGTEPEGSTAISVTR